VRAFAIAMLVAGCASQPMRPRTTKYSLGLVGGYAAGKVYAHGVSGPAAMGYGVLRLPYVALGARASGGSLDGTYKVTTRTVNTSTTPASLGLYAQTTALDRVWAGASLGVEFAQIEDDTMPTVFKTGFTVGVDAGVDLLRVDKHRLTLFGRVETELGSSTDYRALLFGLGWRMY